MNMYKLYMALQRGTEDKLWVWNVEHNNRHHLMGSSCQEAEK